MVASLTSSYNPNKENTDNLVRNCDFELGASTLPDYWESRGGGSDLEPTWSTSANWSGTKGIRWTEAGGNTQGMIRTTDFFPCQTYQMIQICAYARMQTGGATSNFGVQIEFYSEYGTLIQTQGTLYARSTASHSAWAAYRANFIVPDNAVKYKAAFGFDSLSSGGIIDVGSLTCWRRQQVGISGWQGFPFGQVKDNTDNTYPIQAAIMSKSATNEYDEIRTYWNQQDTGVDADATAGTVIDMTESPMGNFSLEVKATTFNTATVDIDIQVSYDNSNFHTVATITDITGDSGRVSITGEPALYVRAYVNTVGASNELTLNLLAISR